jgi:hypothetical protein
MPWTWISVWVFIKDVDFTRKNVFLEEIRTGR